MWYAICVTAVLVTGLLAFFMGKRLSTTTKTESKTTTFLIKSIQAIAELAVLEYITEGVAEIKEKKTSLITVRWKRGLLRYTAKLKLGFDESYGFANTDIDYWRNDRHGVASMRRRNEPNPTFCLLARAFGFASR